MDPVRNENKKSPMAYYPFLCNSFVNTKTHEICSEKPENICVASELYMLSPG